MFLMLTNGPMDSGWKERLEKALAPLGELRLVEVTEVMSQIKEQHGVFIVDTSIVDDVDAVVSNLRTEKPESRIVVMSAAPEWQRARSAFEAGAIDYLSKPISDRELRDTFRQIVEKPLPPWPK